MSQCNGICIMGYELIEGARGVAYPHPQCELHSGYVEPERCPEADPKGWQCVHVENHDGPCDFEVPKMPNPAAPYVWGEPPTETPF